MFSSQLGRHLLQGTRSPFNARPQRTLGYSLSRRTYHTSHRLQVVAKTHQLNPKYFPKYLANTYGPTPSTTGRFNRLTSCVGLTSLGLLTYSLSGILHSDVVSCDPGATSRQPTSTASTNVDPAGPVDPAPLPSTPQSSVNAYELTFGTVCGICAGVFVKKGAKAVAFIFGGVFVLLQYFHSLSIIRVDWGRALQRFTNTFHAKDAHGNARAPTIGSLFTWIVDFLTADFQPRASFIAGFALGLRVG